MIKRENIKKAPSNNSTPQKGNILKSFVPKCLLNLRHLLLVKGIDYESFLYKIGSCPQTLKEDIPELDEASVKEIEKWAQRTQAYFS